MAKRSYGQLCPLATALDVVGDRWTMLIVRELSVGPRRFSDLLANLPGIGTNMLAARAKQLTEDGLITRTSLPPPAASIVYELTPDGRELADALLPIATWGAGRLRQSVAEPGVGASLETVEQRATWALLQLRASHRPVPRATGPFALEVDADRYLLQVGPTLEITQAYPLPAARARLVTTLPTLTAIALGTTSPRQAVREGAAQATGDRRATDALLATLDRTPRPDGRRPGVSSRRAGGAVRSRDSGP